MDADLRRFILVRDRECLAYKYDPKHVCRDRWGRSHWPSALDLLTVEHVKTDLAMGQDKTTYEDAFHLVAMCHAANVGVPSARMREFIRDYLVRINRLFPYKGLPFVDLTT